MSWPGEDENEEPVVVCLGEEQDLYQDGPDDFPGWFRQTFGDLIRKGRYPS